jgi:hypothetical protein
MAAGQPDPVEDEIEVVEVQGLGVVPFAAPAKAGSHHASLFPFNQ